MSKLMVIGLTLLILGIVIITIGFVSYQPQTMTKTETIPHQQVLVDSSFTVSALSYKYTDINIPSGAINPYLDVEVDVYSGNDIYLVVYHGNEEIYKAWVNPSFNSKITLPGSGHYRIVFDNSYSIITSKDVYAKITLYWTERTVTTETVYPEETTYALIIMGAIISLLGTASLLYTIKHK